MFQSNEINSCIYIMFKDDLCMSFEKVGTPPFHPIRGAGLCHTPFACVLGVVGRGLCRRNVTRPRGRLIEEAEKGIATHANRNSPRRLTFVQGPWLNSQNVVVHECICLLVHVFWDVYSSWRG